MTAPAEFKEWKHIDGDTTEKYHLYLCSREWAEKRRAVLDRSEGICERCRFGKVEEIHHLTYERKYDEHLIDLQGLCSLCHEFGHGYSDFDPAKTSSLSSLIDQLGTREPIPTGLPALDDQIGGLFRGELVVLASRPSMGKSALALNIAHAASKTANVLFFDLEMTRIEVAERLLAIASGVPLTMIRKGKAAGKTASLLQGASERRHRIAG